MLFPRVIRGTAHKRWKQRETSLNFQHFRGSEVDFALKFPFCPDFILYIHCVRFPHRVSVNYSSLIVWLELFWSIMFWFAFSLFFYVFISLSFSLMYYVCASLGKICCSFTLWDRSKIQWYLNLRNLKLRRVKLLVWCLIERHRTIFIYKNSSLPSYCWLAFHLALSDDVFLFLFVFVD